MQKKTQKKKLIDKIFQTHYYGCFEFKAEVAQSVEQRTENPCVGGSIPPLGIPYMH